MAIYQLSILFYVVRLMSAKKVPRRKHRKREGPRPLRKTSIHKNWDRQACFLASTKVQHL